MSLRWAIMGLTTAITVALIGQLLDRLAFPESYQIAFIGFSIAGLIDYRFSSRFRLPDHPPQVRADRGHRFGRIREMVDTIRAQPGFLRFSARQLVYVVGARFAVPLIPLYYVREVGATDAWIGIIATCQSLALLVGYPLWRRLAVARGGGLVLLTTLVVGALYPAALSLVGELVVVAALTAVAAVFSAGLDLSLFDELMKRIPRAHGVTFTSIDTTLVNAAGIVAPLLGATTAVTLGIDTALKVASLIGLLGAIMFALDLRGRRGEGLVSPEGAVKPTVSSTGP
jgi:Na+/melibiose symporter-like transporter